MEGDSSGFRGCGGVGSSQDDTLDSSSGVGSSLKTGYRVGHSVPRKTSPPSRGSLQAAQRPGAGGGHRARCSERPLGAAGPALGPPVLSEMRPAPPLSRLLCCCHSTLSGAWHEDPCRPQCPHLQNGNNNNFFTGFWDERVL